MTSDIAFQYSGIDDHNFAGHFFHEKEKIEMSAVMGVNNQRFCNVILQILKEFL